jgi:hypothetical protein
MTADERLALIRVKIERAKQHILQLESDIRTFFDTRPYVVGTKQNPQTRQLIYDIVTVRETPKILASITGDALQNLWSALDHLAYQLVLVGTGKPGPFRHVYFPIDNDATKYEADKMRKVQGMRPAAIKAIDTVKPYKGGNDALWRLDQLNNVDKHRLLITVGSAFRSVDINAVICPHVHTLHPDFTAMLPPLFVRPADRLFPLKAGDELFIDTPDSKVNEQMQFRFDVAFGEP